MQVRSESESLKELDDRGTFVLPHKSIVYVKQLQSLRAERPGEKRCRNGGIDTSGRQQEDRSVSHLLSNILHLVGYECLHRPGGRAAADLEYEIREHRVAMYGVVDFRVVLKPVSAQRVGSDRREPVVRPPVRGHAPPEFLEFGTDRRHAVVVAHPDLFDRAKPLEQRMLSHQVEICATPLSTPVHDLASVVLGDLLVPEAQPENGNVEIVNRAVVVRVLPM